MISISQTVLVRDNIIIGNGARENSTPRSNAPSDEMLQRHVSVQFLPSKGRVGKEEVDEDGQELEAEPGEAFEDFAGVRRDTQVVEDLEDESNGCVILSLFHYLKLLLPALTKKYDETSWSDSLTFLW